MVNDPVQFELQLLANQIDILKTWRSDLGHQISELESTMHHLMKQNGIEEVISKSEFRYKMLDKPKTVEYTIKAVERTDTLKEGEPNENARTKT